MIDAMKRKAEAASTAGPEGNVKGKSAAARHLGGQPENDADARAAGFPSATATGTAAAGAKGKPKQPSRDPAPRRPAASGD